MLAVFRFICFLIVLHRKLPLEEHVTPRGVPLDGAMGMSPRNTTGERGATTVMATLEDDRLSRPALLMMPLASAQRRTAAAYQRGWRGSRRGSRGRASLTVRA